MALPLTSMRSLSAGAPGVTRSSGGAGGGALAYGTKPVLPTAGALQGNISNILNQAIPGFNNLTSSASSIIGSALNGQLPQDVQDKITNGAASQAVMAGMPGSSNVNGTLYGNRTLRDLGLTSLDRQDTGVKDLIGMLQGFSGTGALTPGQIQEQGNAQSIYNSAPDPAAAAAEQERLFNKYSNPAAGTISASSGGDEELPWWISPNQRRLMAQPGGVVYDSMGIQRNPSFL